MRPVLVCARAHARIYVTLTVAMSHAAWGRQCICAQHDKRALLDSISGLQPYSIWCPNNRR